MFFWIALKKLCLWSLYASAVVGSVGVSYQYVNTEIDKSNYPPMGSMIDIGGYRLHLYETGAQHKGPVVILDAGAGCNSLDWALVQPKIAQCARVISFDRAGDGWSDESELPRTSENMADELHLLLQKAGIPGPYIYVGHSFGGINARIYANKFPDEIAGVILVDAGHEDQHKLPLSPIATSKLIQKIALLAAYTGLIRFCMRFQKNNSPLPQDIEQIRRSHVCTIKTIRTGINVLKAEPESLAQLKKHGGMLGNKPLTVITAGKRISMADAGGLYTDEQLSSMFNIWQDLQKDLVTKSSRGKQMIARNSGHMIPHEQPEIIIDAVREMVDECCVRVS